jgi:hypothetical protein
MLTPHAGCCNFINPAEFSKKLILLDGGEASLLTGFAINSDLRAFIRFLAARIRSEPISTRTRVLQSDRDWISPSRRKCPMASAISGPSMSAITSPLDDESELVSLFRIHLLRCSKTMGKRECAPRCAVGFQGAYRVTRLIEDKSHALSSVGSEARFR